MDLIVERSEIKELEDAWTLIYGRRKVGKTFMLRNFYPWDVYFHVTRDGTIWVDGTDIRKITSVEDFIGIVSSLLKSGKRVVIDEFQRLPFGVMERLSLLHPYGTLLLSGSSMRVVREVLGKNSPLLGLLEEHRIGLISPQDMAVKLKGDNALDYIVYLRDPWLIPIMNGKNVHRDLYRVVVRAAHTLTALIGEIFIEEDRKLTATYEGIIESIGSLKDKPSEIASSLYSRGLLSRDSASAVAPYIKNLERMGIVKSIKLYGRRGVIYRMLSPIFTVFYYIRSLYDFDMRVPSYDEVEENIKRIHGLCYEDFIVETLAWLMRGYVRYSQYPEIDGIIVDRRGRPIAVVEVKRGKITKSEVSKFLSKTESINGKKIVVAKNKVEDDVLSLTPHSMLNLIQQGKIQL